MRSINLLVLIVCTNNVLAEVPASTKSVDAEGTEFTFFFTENAATREDFHFDVQIFITTRLDRDVKVRVRLPLIKSKDFQTEFNVIAHKGNVTEVNFPQEIMHTGTGISNKAVHIVSDGNIIVYGINPQRFSSDGFIAIPNNLLGNEYYAVTMPPEDNASQLGVIGVEPGNTEVTITIPNEPTLRIDLNGKTYRAGDLVQVTLHQFETLQLQHTNILRGQRTGDMSGAHIKCSKRCAAFSGDSRTSVEGDSRDLLVDQLPPVTTWGKEFAVPPTPQRPDRPDVLKLVCQQDGTNILVDGNQYSCDAGQSIQVKTPTDSAHYVTATKPVMAAQVVMSQLTADALIQADPSLTLIIPEEQYAQSYTIATSKWSGRLLDGKEYENYLTVVIRKDRVDSVILDGSNVNVLYPNTIWKDVPGTATGDRQPLVTTNFRITPGTHTITTLNKDATFMCIVYGAGDRESYAYMGGMRLQVINPPCTQTLPIPNDKIDNDCDAKIDEEMCDGMDDDGDGQIDEDCAIRNEVVGEADKSILIGQSTTLNWTVYAVDYKSFNLLQLYKQQPTAEKVLLGEGSGSLTMKPLFSQSGHYSVRVSTPVHRVSVDVVTVELTVTGATLKETGQYSLYYTAADGKYNDSINLLVGQSSQQYEIISKDSEFGAVQTARSSQAEPRNLYFTEGKKYSLTFNSIGGLHLTDLPYRMFYDTIDKTGDFDVVGVKENYVTGPVAGLQDVRTIYELIDREWTANMSLNGLTLRATDASNNTVVNAKLNIESLVRPAISCAFVISSDGQGGRIECSVTKVKVPLSTVLWQFDGDITVISSTKGTVSGPYNAKHETVGIEGAKLVLDGIRSSQWPANSRTRVFTVTFNQTNSYTLSAETLVSLDLFQGPGKVTCAVDGQSINCVDKGGNPKVNAVRWQADLYNTNVTVQGGETKVEYVASALQDISSSPFESRASLIINRPIINETYKVIFIRSGIEETSLVQIEAAGIVPGVVQGEVTVDNSTGLILARAEIVGGAPAANTFSWKVQLSNGTIVTVLPAQSDASYSSSQGTTNARGNQEFLLTVSDVSANSRMFVFYASSILTGKQLWSASRTYVVNSNQVSQPAAVTGWTQLEGMVQLTASVTGGKPSADRFFWTLPDGRQINAGTTSGGFIASAANDLANGTRIFYLTLTDGLANTASTYRFTASSGSLWISYFDFYLSPKAVPAVLSSFAVYTSKRVVLYMNVSGGSPNMTSHIWQVPYGGQLSTLTYGGSLGPYTANGPVNLGSGIVQYSLFIDDVTLLPLNVTFIASSEGKNGLGVRQTWWTSSLTHYIVLHNTAPVVYCGLRSSYVQIGDQVELVCTVNPTPIPGSVTHTISNLLYTNIMASGSQRNISSGQTVGPFTFTQKANDGLIEASLFFTLTENFSDLKKYKFIVAYVGGVVVTDIDLDAAFVSIAKQSQKEKVIGVESSSIYLTCRAQSRSGISFGTLQWKRVSIASRKQQVVYDGLKVLEPFQSTARYAVTNKITADNILESTLRIINLQRTDAAEFRCQWDNSSAGNFIVDVIGTSFLVDGKPFNDLLTPFYDNRIYKVAFDFGSVTLDRYQIWFGGVDATDKHTVFKSNQTWFDSFAQENIPVISAMYENPTFVPEVFVIQTYYEIDRSIKPIRTYVLTRSPGSHPVNEGSTDIINIFVNKRPYAKNEVFEVSRGVPVTLVFKIAGQDCSQTFQIIGGDRAVTNQFNISKETDGPGHCVYTYTWVNCPIDQFVDKKMQVIHIRPDAQLILTEHAVQIAAEGTTERAEIPGGCPAENNGGCDYTCKQNAGSIICQCPVGFTLSANRRSCIDVNECDRNPCSAGQNCINTYGSFICLAQCTCDCCDRPNDGRRKRSLDEQPDHAELKLVQLEETSAALGQTTTLVWLSALTCAVIITFGVSLFRQRRMANKIAA